MQSGQARLTTFRFDERRQVSRYIKYRNYEHLTFWNHIAYCGQSYLGDQASPVRSLCFLEVLCFSSRRCFSLAEASIYKQINMISMPGLITYKLQSFRNITFPHSRRRISVLTRQSVWQDTSVKTVTSINNTPLVAASFVQFNTPTIFWIIELNCELCKGIKSAINKTHF